MLSAGWSRSERCGAGRGKLKMMSDSLALLWQIVDFAAIYRIPESIVQ
jgi:hypothetical protein